MIPAPSRLLLATSNEGKVKELSAFLRLRFPQLQVVSPKDLGTPPPDPEENGKTYWRNALIKAQAFQECYGMPVLADDSGLEVDCLDGRPGVESARFGGTGLSWPQRWALLRQSAEKSGIAPPWVARFRCVLCFLSPEREPLYFEGTTEGAMVPQPRGDGGFGYDPVFFSNDLGKTLGEATAEEKLRVSHRSRALAAFLAALS